MVLNENIFYAVAKLRFKVMFAETTDACYWRLPPLQFRLHFNV